MFDAETLVLLAQVVITQPVDTYGIESAIRDQTTQQYILSIQPPKSELKIPDAQIPELKFEIQGSTGTGPYVSTFKGIDRSGMYLDRCKATGFGCKSEPPTSSWGCTPGTIINQEVCD